MKKNIVIFLLTFTALLSSCGKEKETAHVHRYDTTNIDWCFVPTPSGDYTASATFHCLDCSEFTEGYEQEVFAEVSKTRIEPKCTTDGSVTFTAKVNFENKEYSKDKVVTLTQTGHKEAKEYEANETEHMIRCTECGDILSHEAHTCTTGYKNDDTSHWYECDKCKHEYQKADHAFIQKKEAKYLAKEATCSSNEQYFESCSTCGKASTTTFEVPGTIGNHDFYEVNAKEAVSCLEPGYKKHYRCHNCELYFLDNTDPHSKGVDFESQIAIHIAHDMDKHVATEPKCDVNGNVEYYTCKNATDSKIYKDSEGKETFSSLEDTVIEMTGHELHVDGNCTKCSKTIVEAMGLTACTSISDGELGVRNPAGGFFGKKSMSEGAKLNLPTFTDEDKKFIGWFDQTGNLLDKDSTFSGKMEVCPISITKQDNMLTLTDFGYEGSEYKRPTTSLMKLESIKEDATRLDLYFYFKLDSLTSDQIYFHFPTNNDQTGAVHTRIIQKNYANGMNGYCYGYSGSSIPEKGEGSRYNITGISLSENVPIIVHLYIVKNDDGNTYKFGIEAIMVTTGARGCFEYASFTFASGVNYSITDPEYNKIFMNGGTSHVQMKDLW